MHPVIYDVAVSIDGYISGPAGDISKFAHEGAVVDDYFARMAGYATAIMGRATYEFGYRFGLEPGQNPYEHMETFVFSNAMTLPEDSAVKVVSDDPARMVSSLKERSNGPVYLCGGGAFAGSLLSLGLIDRLRLKRAPILLGSGVKLFEAKEGAPNLTHVGTKTYDEGYLYQEFEVG